MTSKNHTSLFQVEVLSIIPDYENHHFLSSSLFTCENNENCFTNSGKLARVHCIDIHVVLAFSKSVVHVTIKLFMSMLPTEYEDFKLQEPVQVARNYFHEFSACLYILYENKDITDLDTLYQINIDTKE